MVTKLNRKSRIAQQGAGRTQEDSGCVRSARLCASCQRVERGLGGDELMVHAACSVLPRQLVVPLEASRRGGGVFTEARTWPVKMV